MKKQTRKDRRKRTWPAGTNSRFNKIEARRVVRRAAKRTELLPQGADYRKLYEHYDINDFK